MFSDPITWIRALMKSRNSPLYEDLMPVRDHSAGRS